MALTAPDITKKTSGRLVSSDGSKHSCTVIIKHKKWHTDKIDFQIKCSHINDLIRCFHQFKCKRENKSPTIIITTPLIAAKRIEVWTVSDISFILPEAKKTCSQHISSK